MEKSITVELKFSELCTFSFCIHDALKKNTSLSKDEVLQLSRLLVKVEDLMVNLTN